MLLALLAGIVMPPTGHPDLSSCLFGNNTAPFNRFFISGVMNISENVKPVRIDQIVIRANTVTEDRVILNELVGLTTGSEFDPKKIFAAEKALLRRGIFDADSPPRIEVYPSERGEGYCDLLVRVGETRTGLVSIGVGIHFPPDPKIICKQAPGALSWLINSQTFDSAFTPLYLGSFASMPNRPTDTLQPRKPLIDVSFADLLGSR